MQPDIQDLLIALLKEALLETFPEKHSSAQITLDSPSDPAFGDLTSNIALRLSRQLKQPPQEIARDLLGALKQKLSKTNCRDYIREAKVEGSGFINIYFSDKYFFSYLKELLTRGPDAFKDNNIGKAKKVLIEFVSANPTGPLSVAHARQAAVGDALAKLMEFLGFSVKREYYLNDEGNQINILAHSVELRLRELNGEKITFPEDHYQGDYIYAIAKAVAQLPAHQKRDLAEFATDYILEIIKKELADFGVHFDSWFSQKELRQSGKIEEVLDLLKAKEFLYEQDGALWFKSTQFGDDKDRVVVKSDGAYTYLAPDIAYHRDKYARGFQQLINLWGPDHHGYIRRLKAAVQALLEPEDSLAIIIVQLATIFRDGTPLQMSTRRGQYITLQEVLEEVGADAARFFFLMRRTSAHLDFDLAQAKKQSSENPVYYVQYAHARIASILKNSQIKCAPLGSDLGRLQAKEELALIKKLWQFQAVLKICISALDPYFVTIYLQELAEGFHKFYDQHRVLGEDEQLSQARLALIQAVKLVLALGLELLGVSCPEKM
jgi:arginyl-tRNA synthetase